MILSSPFSTAIISVIGMAFIRRFLRIQPIRSIQTGINSCIRNQTTAAAAPEVYTEIPPQPLEKKLGQLEQWQLEEFFDKGFVQVNEFFTKQELQPVLEAVEECVDILANRLYSNDKIQDKCAGAGLFERLTLLERQFKGAAVILHKMGYLPVAFRQLWSHERLLNVVEQLVGPDIAGHPVWNLRTKTPQNEQTTVPWHQDNAYLDSSALYTLQPAAWIPLIDTNTKNGCMQMVSGAHRLGMTATHTCCAGDTWYVDLAEDEMEKTLGVDLKKDIVTCEVPFGGVLFLNNCIPHRSLENFSDKIRWSLDLRWQDPSKPNGFCGTIQFSKKDGVIMRKASDPKYKINWEDSGFKALHRSQLNEHSRNAREELETTIYGPWMEYWEITHPNRHTNAMIQNKGSSLLRP